MTAALARFSINQMTVRDCPLPALAELAASAGIPALGLWREPVAELGFRVTAELMAERGLRVSSLCRGGFVTASDPGARAQALADNRRAVDEAAALGAPCLVLVVGGLPDGSRDLAGARGRVADAVHELAGYAGAAGVRLALEPLHPMFCADRAVLSTLAQALDLAEQFPATQVGVVVDTYHVWWDPDVIAQIARASGRIASFQICDWMTPLPADALLGRGIPGDGHIDFAPLFGAVEDAGYRGDIEVEIFNEQIWAADPSAVIGRAAQRYLELAATP